MFSVFNQFGILMRVRSHFELHFGNFLRHLGTFGAHFWLPGPSEASIVGPKAPPEGHWFQIAFLRGLLPAGLLGRRPGRWPAGIKIPTLEGSGAQFHTADIME